MILFKKAFWILVLCPVAIVLGPLLPMWLLIVAALLGLASFAYRMT